MMAFRELNNGSRVSICHWMHTIRLSRLIGLLLLILIVVPLVAHYYISNLAMDGGDTSEGHRTRKIQDHDEISSSKLTDLRFQIDDLKRIKASVNNELRDLENKRQRLHAEISGYNTHIEELKTAYEKTRYELEQLKVTIENTKLEQEEIIKRNMPEVAAPKRILPSLDTDYVAPPSNSQQCHMHTCFDYSRCSLTSGFPVFVYNSDKFSVTGATIDTFIKLSITQSIHASPYYTKNPDVACIYVVLVGDINGGLHNSSRLGIRLQNLPYWNGDGRNHVLLNVARYYSNRDVFNGVNTGRAIIVQSAFMDNLLRTGFDLVIPPSLGLSQGDTWDELQPIVPALRRHLLSFQGDYWGASPKGAGLNPVGGAKTSYPANQMAPLQSHDSKLANQELNIDNGIFNGARSDSLQNKPHFLNKEGERVENQLDKEDSNPNIMPHFRNLLGLIREGPPVDNQVNRGPLTLLDLDYSIIDVLKRMQVAFPSDNFHFAFTCDHERMVGVRGEWCLCGADNDRRDRLHESTFSLIIAPTDVAMVTTVHTQVRIYEALKYGAIPVILGDHIQLPFSELLTWKKAVITLPKARITELHLILRTFSDPDILEMRRYGRIFWETYFGTTDSILKTILATIRTRLKITAAPVQDEPTPSVFGLDFQPLKEEIPDVQLQADDILGPIEAPFPSAKYRRNYTSSNDWFNMVGDPFHSYPFTPFEPVMPGEAKFKGSGLGFRPIGKGEGGAGREFSEALGGNLPREQFTVVILTYEREAVLIDAIARLKGLPHLNKVLVVWNNPQPPADDLRWPEIGVEVIVVRTAKNSLNNRFLPYDAIETEAILSIDDDAHLRHDEIVFGFRVWRENRDRIVGFPGRFHAWDLKGQSFAYNSNYSCELSMVLTGAAFFHKYYSYLYSHVMPQAIRDKVDEYLNCEDLAMNFLVSHITRKPPIKVTSRWTFRCPGCPNALSVDDSHFQERHKCINFFVKVYGYMPLMYTQYRVDSVLFKTRISHDKQKCFKYI